MVLIQFKIEYDDLVNTYGLNPLSTTYGNPVTTTQYCNLYGGPYRARFESCSFVSGAYNLTTFQKNPQILNISSSAFVFPGNASPGFNISNNGAPCEAIFGNAKHEFIINSIRGNIDIKLNLTQYGTSAANDQTALTSPYTVNKTLNWAKSSFTFVILTLDVVPLSELEKVEKIDSL
jgi:hypothetical protein